MLKKLIILISTFAAIGFAVWFFFLRENNQTVSYKTAKVERGHIESRVSATGTINPVITVQVGSQVSGTIKDLYADFNSKVKEGQVIAKLDQKTFSAQRDQARANLVNAEANVERSRADLVEKKQKFKRVSSLFKEGLIAGSERDVAEAAFLASSAQLKSAEAQVKQHKAALELAEVNLGYTVIKSPVDGIVISRNVDIGQTVAASFQTPTLFTIAKDLTEMQVNTNVDEADIGAVRVGQEAQFTVDAYPELTFQGKISQIRNAPVVIQNVVTYDVIIDAPNKDAQLKPGMTANVSILISRRDNVLKVLNSALRFKHSEEVARGQANEEKGTKVWVLGNGLIRPVFIKTGISDGTYTEVVEGNIAEGDGVVIEAAVKNKKSGKTSAPGFHGFIR